MELTIVTVKPEEIERQGDIDWVAYSAEEISSRFEEYIPASDDMRDDQYTMIDQFLGAAEGQPGVTFGFRAGESLTPVLLKYEDGEFFLGTVSPTSAFTGITGNDGDADVDDLSVYPSAGSTSASRNEARKDIRKVKGIVESLLSPSKGKTKDLSEAEVDRIALSLLED